MGMGMGIPYLKCTMIFAVIVSILSHLLSCIDGNSACFHRNWYIISHMLLAKKKFKKICNIRKADEKMCMPLLEPRKKPKIVRRHRDSYLPDDIMFNILVRISRAKYGIFACVSKRFRSLIGNNDLYNLRNRLGVTEQWVYVYSSSHHWEAFDLERHRWISLPNIPSTQVFSESLAMESKLLAFGYQDAGFAIWVYNFFTNEWSRCHPMKFSRSKFASGSRGKVAIIAGGIDKDDNVLKAAELYNSETGVWETLPDMNCPRQMCAGFFINENFYVIGGLSSNGERLTCGEEYNFETRTWRTVIGMYPTASFHSSPQVAVVNDELYAADPPTRVYRKYDKLNNTWTTVGTLPIRNNRASCVLKFTSYGDRLLLVSGIKSYPPSPSFLNSWYPEDENGGQLERSYIGRRNSKRRAHICVVIGC